MQDLIPTRGHCVSVYHEYYAIQVNINNEDRPKGDTEFKSIY